MIEVSIPAATNAIEGFLIEFQELTDDVVNECDDLLLGIWKIENPLIRQQIIELAALNLGLLREDELQ